MTSFASIVALMLWLPGPVTSLDSAALLYIGPDQLLPFSSFLGAALGFLLMFWNRIVGAFRRLRQFRQRR
jgi:hypothetical protein